jgi:predicted RNA-binding protein with PIN domain
MNKILVIDGNNIVHRNYHLKKNINPDLRVGADMCIANTLYDFKNYYDKYEPQTTIIAFDSGETWREKYTKSENAITNRIYKSNRNKKKTRKEIEAKKYLNEKIDELVKVLKRTKLFILQKDGIEADDFVGVICDMYKNEHDTEVIVVSSDKDYLQFLKHDNVKLINPMKNGKARNLEEWNNDVGLMLFEKCIRGDNGDHVRSSYPRLRKNKLVEAYYDDVKRTNLMNHEFEETVYCERKEEYENKKFNVGELFSENELLMCLDKQPPHIKKEIKRTIIEEMGEEKPFEFVNFFRFVKRNELNNVANNVNDFKDLLANKSHN